MKRDNLFWNIFEETGYIEAYLTYNAVKQTDDKKYNSMEINNNVQPYNIKGDNN